MNQNPVVPLACHLDLSRRLFVPVRRRAVLVAAHLPGHPFLHLADALLADISAGRPLAGHLSPMKNQRRAFKRANRNGRWTDYRRFMDHLLNKWQFRHFHCGGGSVLAFVHFCERTAVARLLDLVPHDGSWLVEKRLVGIAVRNWPDGGIARDFGQGSSRMTEEDLFAARRQGLNMEVHVDGTYYLPAQGGLMSDGSGHAGPMLAPYFIMGRRFEPREPPTPWVESPRSLILGVDPDDPRTPHILAAGQMGVLVSGLRDP